MLLLPRTAKEFGMEKVPMTAEGLAALEEEKQRLRSEERPAVIRAIAEAREHGDLSENAEYHAARERQSFIEGRLLELDDVISRAEVIDLSKLEGKVIRFGANVKLADEDTDEETSYQIVGAHESDISAGKASLGDWPTYRNDPARNGRAKTSVRAELKTKWTTKIDGTLTTPVSPRTPKQASDFARAQPTAPFSCM